METQSSQSTEGTKEKPNTESGIKLERVIGLILLAPPLIGVLLFILNLLSNDLGNVVELRNLSSDWTGSSGDTGGHTSAAPIFLGLMAIAGALLLKGTDKK